MSSNRRFGASILDDGGPTVTILTVDPETEMLRLPAYGSETLASLSDIIGADAWLAGAGWVRMTNWIPDRDGWRAEVEPATR